MRLFGFNLSLTKAADKAWKTDPWVVLDQKGHIQKVTAEVAPKGALKYGGQPLSVRQIFYRFIAADALPASWADAAGVKNTERSYKRLAKASKFFRRLGRVFLLALGRLSRFEYSHIVHATLMPVLAAVSSGQSSAPGSVWLM